jgi:hypothetical protein
MRREDFNALGVADRIQRVLNGESAYPQEWNDFVEESQPNKQIEKIRKECYARNPLVNGPVSRMLARARNGSLLLRSRGWALGIENEKAGGVKPPRQVRFGIEHDGGEWRKRDHLRIG